MSTRSLAVATALTLAGVIPARAHPPTEPVPAEAPPEAPPEAPRLQPSEPPPVAEQAPRLPEWLSRIDLSGIATILYRHELGEGARGFSTFDVTRTYLTVQARPTDTIKFKLTLDGPSREANTTVRDGVTTVSPGSGRLDVVVKHAFVELGDVLAKGLSLKLGMHDLPWVPFVEKVWGYRFQGPIMTDREGYLASTDLGIGVSYAAPSRVFEAHVSVVNGETWARPEVSRHKDVQGRITVRPLVASPALSGLAMSVFGNFGTYDYGTDQDRHRLCLALAYEHTLAAVGVEVLMAWDPPGRLASRHPSLADSTDAVVQAFGWSAYGWLDFAAFGGPEGVRLMARVDALDPDTNLERNGHMREILGVSYRLNRYVHLLVDAELVQHEDAARAGTDEARMFLHSSIGF